MDEPQARDEQHYPTYDEGWAAPPPTPSPVNRRRRRLLALGTATALVLGAGGVGYGVGHLGGGPQSSAGQQTTGQWTPPQQGNTPWDNQEGQSGGTGGFPTSPNDNSSGTSGTGSVAAAGDQLTGLVRVSTTLGYQNGRAAGTGMILTSDGEVVTNHHVVEGATKVTVKVMSTGQKYSATVVGTDAKDDVAVLQLSGATGLQTVTPDTDGIGVGDAVTAVGDANGLKNHLSAASGTVTATKQAITTSSEGGSAGERLRGLIEISSDVISGDSGGATYDAQGEVVGMTTAASTGGRDVVGYAIPISKVIRIAADLDNGTAKARYTYGNPAFLGVGLANGQALVGGVYAGTPAARAGITPGDTITSVNGTHVGSSDGLRKAIQALQPGDQMTVTWTDRQGASHTAQVTLTTGPVE
jgi:S1-C subfamily serine protease